MSDAEDGGYDDVAGGEYNEEEEYLMVRSAPFRS